MSLVKPFRKFVQLRTPFALTNFVYLSCVFAAAFSFSIAFASCSNDIDTDGGNLPSGYGPKVSGQSLIGPNANPGEGYGWESGGLFNDGFIISEVSGGVLEFTQFDSYGYGISFSGIIVGDAAADWSLLSCEYGYLTIQINNPGTWGKTDGYYYVIHWQGLGNGLVSQSSAFRTGSAYNNGVPNQAFAESEFTVENGYFGYHGLYRLAAP